MALSSRVGTARGERGASLLGLLVTLVILGVTVAIAASAFGGGAARTRSSASGSTASSLSGSTNADIQAALNATCVADYAALSNALQFYVARHGANPPAGTAWFTAGSSARAITPWPSDPGHYRFTWNGRDLGVTPAHGASSAGSSGSAFARGCYAPLS